MNVALENGWRNKSKVVLADGEVVHTAGKGSRPSKVIQTTIRNKNSNKNNKDVLRRGCTLTLVTG